jgi:hypothetical protein
LQAQNAVGMARQIGTVGDQDQGLAEPAYQLVQQFRHPVAGGRIQVAGGFVGQNQVRLVNQGAGHGDPLLLPAGQRVGETVPITGQIDGREHVRHGAVSRAAPPPQQLQRQAQVFRHRQGGQQVEELEHEADVPAAQQRAFPFAEGGDVDAAHLEAAGLGAVDAADQVEQGGFARAAAAHQRHRLAGGDFQRGIRQHVVPAARFGIAVAYALQAHHGLSAVHPAAPGRPGRCS